MTRKVRGARFKELGLMISLEAARVGDQPTDKLIASLTVLFVPSTFVAVSILASRTTVPYFAKQFRPFLPCHFLDGARRLANLWFQTSSGCTGLLQSR
jgi:hypothetical protein